MNYLEQIYTIENLMLAWRKIEKAFEYGNVWFDPILMSAFKMRLVENLTDLSQELRNGTYNPSPIMPVPFPKGKDSKGDLRVRQSFFISIKDQLVWVAVCNIIGWRFDKQMPAWSYGNRLFLYMWKEDNVWKFGNYRHSYRHIYKKWNQSWPAMRKRITASLQCMARISKDDMRFEQQQTCEQEQTIPETDNHIRLKYLDPNYFPAGTKYNKLYWMGLDLEKFYQNVSMEKVVDLIQSELELSEEDPLLNLLHIISKYEVDYRDYPSGDRKADEDLLMMQLEERPAVVDYLPTGLLVAGFLANVYLLDIDKAIDAKLDGNKDIIHFRYVDDHVFISTSAEKLYNWVSEYKEMLEAADLTVNPDKLEPHEVWKEGDADGTIKNIEQGARIIPKYPTPLMTQTLAKVSQLSNMNMSLLSSNEFDLVFNDLQSLLVTDIPEQEIKKNTRISFACTMLSRLLVNGDIDYDEVYRLRRLWIEYIGKLPLTLRSIPGYENWDNESILSLCNNLKLLVFNDATKIQLDELSKKAPGVNLTILTELNSILDEGEEMQMAKNRQVFEMMCYALKQVPDKVKVWVRTLIFCSKHYPRGCNELYDLLFDLRNDGELHKLSIEYIYSLLNVVSAELIIKAVARLKADKYTDSFVRENDLSFLKKVAIFRNFEFSHSFVNNSILMFNKAKGLANIMDIKGLDKYESAEELIENRQYNGVDLDETFWARWCVDFVSSKSPKEEGGLEDGFEILHNLYDEKSIYFPQWETIQNLPPLYNEDGFISIRQWIEYVNNPENNVDDLDVLRSELLAVKILIAICDYIGSYVGDLNDNFSITIDNILLKEKDVIGHNWNHYRANDCHIEVKHQNENNVFGDAYMHPFIMDNTLGIHNALTYALGMIFLQILTKKSDMPWVFNRSEYGYEWHSVLNDLMHHGHISSLNYRIVSSCLSLRSRETRMLVHNLEGNFIDDTYRDKPDIKIWADMRNELQKSLNHLMQNLISVANEEHRQLTVIDLD